LGALRLGVVGAGKIARDQHIPAIAANEALELVGFVDPVSTVDGVRSYPSLEEMIKNARPAAIAVCTPPRARYEEARMAIGAGLHVLLEKPPCATVGEVEDLAIRAKSAGVTLYTAWHSQHAPAVSVARDWVVAHPVRRIKVDWREDVRRWHPGQDWIWRPGGFGVFDPGINALSILTTILPETVVVERARLEFPANCDTPIAAQFALGTASYRIDAEFDWRHTGPQTWDISVEALDGAKMLLSKGGHQISIGSQHAHDALQGEYPSIYRRFAELVSHGLSEVHVEPLRLAADTFLLAERVTTEAFVM
jgi:D-galactose 1-dehydrogenase